MRKMLRRSRTFTPFTGRSIPRWGISIPIALCVWLLVAAAHAQQPPPVKTTWLWRISDGAADTVRPLLGFQAEVSGIAGTFESDIPVPGTGGCAYCAANMFLALEQGGNRKPLPPGIRFDYLPVSARELENITGKINLLVYVERQEDQLAFLRENLGPGDHAIISIKMHLLTDGRVGPHAVNVANVNGELLVFDGVAAANGDAGVEGVPLGDFFANGIPGRYRVLAEDFRLRSVQVQIRSGRDYFLPADNKMFLDFTDDGQDESWHLQSTSGESRVRISSDELVGRLTAKRAELSRRSTCQAPT